MAVKARKFDFSDVQDRSAFSPKRMPSGDYRAKVVSVEEKGTKADPKKLQWVFAIQLTSNAKAVYPFYCGLDKDALWKVRNLGLAAGLKLPKSRVALDPNKIVGKEIGISLEDDEYDGKPKSTIDHVFPASDLDDDADEPDDDDDEDGDDSDDEDEADDDSDSDDDDDTESDDEEDDDDEDLDLDDDDEDDEPEPVKPVKKAKAKAAAAPAKTGKAKKAKDEEPEPKGKAGTGGKAKRSRTRG